MKHPVYKKEDFDNTLKWIKKRVDPNLAKRVEKVILDKLSSDPLRATGRIQADSMKPMRYIKIGKRRLYFISCIECREEGYMDRWNCPNCEVIEDEAIIIMNIDKRESAYNW